MDPHHFSSQSSAYFQFNVDQNLNLLNNEISEEGEGHSIQQNIIAPNDTECSTGMGSTSILPT
jgi:hypothetical protein